jgi:hypothetical protein
MQRTETIPPSYAFFAGIEAGVKYGRDFDDLH